MDHQQKIPLGYKFKFEPEDHELLVYLKRKSREEPLPCEGVIMELDLYQLPDPALLFERTPEKVVHVFTKVKKVAKDRNGKRIGRSVSGTRTWKGVNRGNPIYDAEGRVVGAKKNFVLVNKMKMKLGYNMIEYSLDNDTLKNSKFKDYVICRIKKKDKKLRSLQYDNFPEEETCPTTVSTPAAEGDAVAISEVGYQHDEGKSIIPNQSQTGEAQQCYQVSESHEGMSSLMPMLSGDLGSDTKLLSSEYCDPNMYQEVNSWTIDHALQALDWSMIDELASAPPLTPLLDDYSALPPLLDDYSAEAQAPPPPPPMPPDMITPKAT